MFLITMTIKNSQMFLVILMMIFSALEYTLITLSIGAMAVLMSFLFITMIRWTSPTVCSMVRRTEVLMVLVVDVAFYSIYPNVIGAVGYCLVIVSSLGMVLAPNIEKRLCSKPVPTITPTT